MIEVPSSTIADETVLNTFYFKQNLRSGKVIKFSGNVIIVGDVHAGSEVAAGGDITVWGELKGIAHAGMNGNYRAEIRAWKIEALQLRIAEYIARRPDRMYYHRDANTLRDEGEFSPQVARVSDGEIKVFKEFIGR